MKPCKRCDEKYLPQKTIVYRYGELLHKTCSCGDTYIYVSKVKLIDLKNGHVRLDMPD